LVIETDKLRVTAHQLLGQGRLREALAAHLQLLESDPSRPDDWFNLGYLQRCDRQFEPALLSYASALARGISGPEEVLVNRAAILSEHLGRADEAERELLQAIEANAGFMPAWLNLAHLYEDSGQIEQAQDTYQHILRLSPFNSRALVRLSAMEIHQRGVSSMIEDLREGLSMQSSPADMAEVSFGLAQALDANGRFDDAFDMYSKANNIRAAGIDPRRRYDRRRHEKLIEEIIGTFADADSGEDVDAKTPIFVCGMFRSGSTLSEQILARHPRVTAGGELELIPALVSNGPQPYPAAIANVDRNSLAVMREPYLHELDTLFPHRDILIDKRCDNFLHIGFIKKLFPHAKFIHTKRNMLDNILSIFFLDFDDSISYGFALEDIEHWYHQYLKLMAHWRAIYGPDIFELDYDDLVTDPQTLIQAALEFCGAGWDEVCLGSTRSTEAIKTPSAWQVRRPIHGGSSGRWRNYAKKLSAQLQAPKAP
jgi:tetratricopeptide (TPR) repeat protein